MKRGIVLYQSKYGAAKKYAYWLQEATGFPCVQVSSISQKEVAPYETIILCGGVYASSIAGLSFLKKNISSLRGKEIVIFCTGASPYDARAFEEIKAHNLRGELKGIPVFYGRGAWDESKMTFRDRNLCKLLQKFIAKKDPRTYEPWMVGLMSAAGQKLLAMKCSVKG